MSKQRSSVYTTDKQKSVLYRWEERVLAPRCDRHTPYANAQMLVDGIWLAERWKHPPKVVPLSPNNKTAWAKGGRGQIQLPPEGVPTRVLIHEISHACSSEHTCGNGHGPDFLGIYFYLLDKYCQIPYPLLLYTADQDQLKYNLSAKPWFLD